jgi:hypothetical protein
MPAAGPAPVPQWEVRGAFRESGKEAVLMISAPTQSAAEYEATQNGLLVESCWPARVPASPPQAAPVGPLPLGYAQPWPPPPPPMPFGRPTPHVLIERTAKKFKWQLLVSFLLAIFGLFSGCLFAPLAARISPQLGLFVLILGIGCLVGGLIWGTVVKWTAWWHHG